MGPNFVRIFSLVQFWIKNVKNGNKMVFFAVLEISLSSDFSKINLNLVFGKILVLEL